MAKCNKCGKSGLFFKVNTEGKCKECSRILLLQREETELLDKITKHQEEITKKASLRILLLQREETELLDKITKNREEITKTNESLEQIKIKRYSIFAAISNEAKNDALLQISDKINEQNSVLQKIIAQTEEKQQLLIVLTEEYEKTEKSILLNANKTKKFQTMLKSMQYSAQRYFESEGFSRDLPSNEKICEVDELLSTTVKLKLHLMDIRELRKLYNQNEKIIQEILVKYQGRYTTKANMTIYKLMVIALEAELQNVLFNLSYSKLDKAVKDIKAITAKYLKIATDGNQSIATTVTKFIGEIEFLFIEAIKIEYEYYIQKARIKEEQKAIREQMRQEAAEIKLLEEERKKVEQEELKYQKEIANIKDQIANTSDATKIIQLEERITKVQLQLDDVEKKKEEIINLQNGKAGYIYIISNLGTFGESTFKVGMTRRLEPQDRVDELGDASVPFKFDVHSFIFSNSARDLENNLHKKLHNKRVNKINLRKEFFNTTIDELEEIVYGLEPSAEFNRTMLAEQYFQSMAVDIIPESVNIVDDENYIDEAL